MSCDKAREAILLSYNLKEVDDCIAKMVKKDLRPDFKQELFLILLQVPCEKITQMNGELKYFVVRIILNLCRQKRNVFHKTYLDKTVQYDTDKLAYHSSSPADVDTMSDRITREQEEDRLINKLCGIDAELGNNNYPYHEEMIKLIAELGSMWSVTRQTGIPHTTIRRTVKRVREYLQR